MCESYNHQSIRSSNIERNQGRRLSAEEKLREAAAREKKVNMTLPPRVRPVALRVFL